MVRLLLAAVGLVQLATPDWVVYVYTRLAYEHPETIQVRPWVPLAVRLEGGLMLWLALRDDGGGPDERPVVERVTGTPEPQ